MARRAAPVLLLINALLLGGCAAAVLPLAGSVAAGKRIADAAARSGKTPPISASAQKERAKSGESKGYMLTVPPPLKKEVTPPVGYEAMLAYTLKAAGANAPLTEHKSALLANPASLKPVRTDCGILPPAIILDLDSGANPIDPVAAFGAHKGLAEMLGHLREEDITIFWISAAPSRLAASLQRMLIGTGLDPRGTDRLLLLRSDSDSKQARRQEAGTTHCIAAIAGDTRADFDELFQYLKREEAAKPLDELVDNGWFLTPLPLTPSISEGQK